MERSAQRAGVSMTKAAAAWLCTLVLHAAATAVCAAESDGAPWLPAIVVLPYQSRPLPPDPDAPLRARPTTLDARTLLQLALLQNSDLLYAKLQSRVAAEGFEAETGLYRPIAYGALRREGRSRPRTIEERLTAALGGIARLEELGRSGEMGLRVRTPTGAEASLSLRSGQRRSNVIGSAQFATGDSESAGALVLTLRQPLLRGAGREVTETDLRVADAERAIGGWQLRQQALRVGSDALGAFAQLQRAYVAQTLRLQALDNARSLLADTRARIDGGRLAPAAIEEAQLAVAGREAEVARGVQAVAEAEARVRVLLDLPADDGGWALAGGVGSTGAAATPPITEPGSATARAAARLPAAQAAWPALRIAQLRRAQAVQRLTLADDRLKPAFDVQLSYSSNSLTAGPLDAAQQATRGRNPDWAVGLAVELPLGGDERAKAQQRAQALRLQQAELEIRAVRQALASDLHSRVVQLDAIHNEQAQLTRDLESRRALFAADELQFNAGSAPLNRLLRRQADLLEAQLRIADVETRVALARVALQLADGTLLEAHDVRIEE